MIYLFIGLLVLAWLLAVLDNRRLERELEASKKAGNDYYEEFRVANNRAFHLQCDLEEAEKKLIDLEGQTPGRDKSGRFVKHDKVSVEKV